MRFQNQINQIKLQNTDSKQEKKKNESNDSSAPIKRYKKFSNLLLNSFTTRPTRNYSRTTVLTFKVIAVPTCAKFRLLPPFNILDLISSGFFAAMVQDVFEKIYKKYSKTCTCVQMVRISYCNVNKKKVKLVKLVWKPSVILNNSIITLLQSPWRRGQRSHPTLHP